MKEAGTVRSILALAAALIGATAASAQDLYHVAGHADACPLGVGGLGIIAVGPGKVSITETHYERAGPRKTGADGWQTARWHCMSEGEPCGDVDLSRRITPRAIAVKGPDGLIEGRRCP